MADKPHQSEETVTELASTEDYAGQGRLARFIHWSGKSRLRMLLAGSLAILCLGSIFAAWSYVARLAVTEENPATLARALEALDKQNYEEARSIVRRMQQNEDASQNFGSSLFVLGAVKAAEAEQEWSSDRKRAVYLVAARYLQKAQELGVPPVREASLKYLLGLSLIRGNQSAEGIEFLEESLADERLPPDKIHKIHTLLTDAHLTTPEPNLEAALKHNEYVLQEENLTDNARGDALIIRAKILGKQGKVEEAFEQLDAIGPNYSHPATLESIAGRLCVIAAEKLPTGNAEQPELLDRAEAKLREAQRLEPLNSKLIRESMYWIGRSFEARGRIEEASEQYDRISKLYGETEESIVATLAKADLARSNGQIEQALSSYRNLLETVGNPVTYVNHLLPLTELKKRLIKAHLHFVESKQFEQAVLLVDQFTSLFSQIEVTELQGKTHKAWGNHLLSEAESVSNPKAAELKSAGRYQLRAAGRAFETLARLRFATNQFSNDLWAAADNYFLGQSFSHAARVLEEYLHHETINNNAKALLRLGQSLLAIKENEKAIIALEECIELHPSSGDIYQARLECVHAFRHNGQEQKAQEFLLANLRGEQLTPKSLEWRDSLFTLGELYYDQNMFKESIEQLDHAVRRYPKATQALMGRYTIARAYHSSAKEPAERMKLAKTENERLKNRKVRDEQLEEALKNYRIVQKMISEQAYNDKSMLINALKRNCYMMQGSVLFQLKRYEEARIAYGNVSTLFQDEPFVLESFVHIANCWRRLNQPIKARGTIAQAKLVLGRLPADTNFKIATNFSRDKWVSLLDEMEKW